MKRQALDALARRYPEDFQRIYEQVRRGESVGEVTVGEWAEQWSKLRLRVARPGTINSERAALKRWILPLIGDKPISGVQRSDIRAIHQAAEDAHLADSSVQRIHAVVRKLLRDAEEEGYEVQRRTLSTPHAGGAGKAQRVALSVDQARRILDVAMLRPDASRWVAALLQGMRPAEARGLRWQAVDLDRGIMRIEWQLKAIPYNEPRNPDSGFRVPRGFEAIRLENSWHLVRPKTESGIRTVPLVPWLRRELAAWAAICPPSEHDLVWTNNGRPLNAGADRADWLSIVDEAGVVVTQPNGKTRRPLLYECRHTAATLLASAGVDDTTLTSIVGHSKILSTQAYLHTDETRKLAALEKVGETIGVHL